ncbi:hypothetical protein MtrunA17_Chr4g0013481 [Medicago truncatula]|uniref:Uncharacterized protein n=1 Tax=Medicago truncatula TaxID=3880 RepID=A0A396I723_MEDTR|nr:hypothetical protein MtrunA17_Chr4g0013481 [Medicago truncatula]
MTHTYSAQTILWGAKHGNRIQKQVVKKRELKLKKFVRISIITVSRLRPVVTSFRVFRIVVAFG